MNERLQISFQREDAKDHDVNSEDSDFHGLDCLESRRICDPNINIILKRENGQAESTKKEGG